jgi:hypothetical protein
VDELPRQPLLVEVLDYTQQGVDNPLQPEVDSLQEDNQAVEDNQQHLGVGMLPVAGTLQGAAVGMPPEEAGRLQEGKLQVDMLQLSS